MMEYKAFKQYTVPAGGVILDIKNDMKWLKRIREEGNTREFLEAINQIMEKYSDSAFDPDLYFPNKMEFKYHMDIIEDNIDTAELLMRSNRVRDVVHMDAIIENLEAAKEHISVIRALKWAKIEDDIQPDELSEVFSMEYMDKIRGIRVINEAPVLKKSR